MITDQQKLKKKKMVHPESLVISAGGGKLF